MMKKLLALLTMLPFVTFADIYIPPTYHRYQRVGYEVLPDAEALIRENAWGLGLLTVVVSVLIGMIMCLYVRKAWRTKIWGKAQPIIRPVLAIIVLTSYCSIPSVTLMFLLLHIMETGMNPLLFSTCLCMMALIIIPLIFRRRIEKAFPMLFRRKIKIACGYCVFVICICCACWSFWLFFEPVIRSSLHDRDEPRYDPAPGWKYPTELSMKEQADFNSRLNSLPLRMRELIEAKWRKDLSDGSDEHAKTVVLGVLSSDAELRSACIGIPVELIVSHYFITDYEWYTNEWNQYRRSSFMHPQTVRWADIEWKIEKKTREIVAKNRRKMEKEKERRSNKFDDTDAVLHDPPSSR